MKPSLLLGLLLSLCLATCGLASPAPRTFLTPKVAAELNPVNFHPDFSEYDKATALFCARLADLAYEEAGTIEGVVGALNRQYPQASYRCHFIADQPSHTELILFGSPGYVVIALRGTHEWKDFYEDVKVRIYSNLERGSGEAGPLAGLPSGHGGFRRGAMNLLQDQQLFGQLSRFIEAGNPGKTANQVPVYFTGHSLGAAVSSLLIAPLRAQGFSFGGAYHFAPPLAVWWQQADSLRQLAGLGDHVYDLVNNTDYIARAGRSSRANLKHIGKFYRICRPNEGRRLLCFEQEEVYQRNRLAENLFFWQGLFSKYHLLQFYISGLEGPGNSTPEVVKRQRAGQECADTPETAITAIGLKKTAAK